jgi:ribosomal protein S18 acetylase RimI-like enzyme
MLERRPAAATDEGFLRELYATTRPEVAGWDDEAREAFLDLQFNAQRQDWESRFPASAHELVLLDGRLVGRLWVAWLPGECRLVDLAILPDHRRSGIGTQVAGETLAEADRNGVPVRLSVERTNEPALAFWTRLDFAVVDEDPVYLALERPVSRARPQQAFR